MIRQFIMDTLQENIVHRYSDFTTPMSREAFWKFMLAQGFVINICFAILGWLSTYSVLYVYMVGIWFAILFLCFIGLTLPNVGAMARRLQDSNTSAWLLLLGFIPYIGIIILAILFLQSSKSNVVASYDENQMQAHRPKGYGGMTIVVVFVVSLLGSIVGSYGFISSTGKEMDAYRMMEPGAFMTLAVDTLQSNTAVSDAKQVVTAYYGYLQQGNYQVAYRLLSHRERERYGTFEQWNRSVIPSHMRVIDTIYLERVYIDDDDVKHIDFNVTYTDRAYPQEEILSVVLERKEWRIQSIISYDE